MYTVIDLYRWLCEHNYSVEADWLANIINDLEAYRESTPHRWSAEEKWTNISTPPRTLNAPFDTWESIIQQLKDSQA